MDKSDSDNSPMAVFVDNDNIIYSIRKNTRYHSYDVEGIMNILENEGSMRIGRVYFNPGEFGKENLLHMFWSKGFQPVYTASFEAEGEKKSLADPKIISDINSILYERSEIKKFAIISGDKDFVPIIRKLKEHGKEVVIMYVEGTEAEILEKDAERLNITMEDVPGRKEYSGRGNI